MNIFRKIVPVAVVFMLLCTYMQLHSETLLRSTLVRERENRTKSIEIRNENGVDKKIVAVPSTRVSSALQSVSWQKKNAILPITFGLPSNRFSLAKNWKNLSKTRDFAHIIPGVKNTYVYDTENEYYNGYSESLFGVTFKKAGWDCFRHYEIIASGSMPYFLDIASIPNDTMFDFPKSIVRQAMGLPGVPSEQEVKAHIAKGSTAMLTIDHNIFNISQFNYLMDTLVAYAAERLTWSGKVERMISSIRIIYPCMADPRILMVTMDSCEYQSCVVFGGVYELFGPERMSSYFGPKRDLFKSLSRPSKSLYGKGISYRNTFDEWNITRMNQLLKKRLDDGFFNMIIYTNGGNTYCGLDKYFPPKAEVLPSPKAEVLLDYQKKYNPIVVAVDGNDEGGCHDLLTGDPALAYHILFVREFHKAKASQLSEWSGCNNIISL